MKQQHCAIPTDTSIWKWQRQEANICKPETPSFHIKHSYFKLTNLWNKQRVIYIFIHQQRESRIHHIYLKPPRGIHTNQQFMHNLAKDHTEQNHTQIFFFKQVNGHPSFVQLKKMKFKVPLILNRVSVYRLGT